MLMLGVADGGWGQFLAKGQQVLGQINAAETDLDGKIVNIGAIRDQVVTIASSLTGLAGAATANSVSAMRQANTDAVKFDLLGFSAALDGGAGAFIYDPNDTTSPDDGAMCIVKAGGKRYKRSVPNGVLIPQMFGAKAQAGFDSGPAFQQMLNYPGSWKFMIPAGRYYSSIELSRANFGNTTLWGDGQRNTTIVFTGNTHGFRIYNTDNGPGGNYGRITYFGLTIESGGVKTGGKEAIYMENQHINRPGSLLQDIGIKCLVPDQQWSTAIHSYNCSGMTYRDVLIEGANQERLVGIWQDCAGTPAKTSPSVENTYDNVRIQTCFHAFLAMSTGSAGIEGTKINNCYFISTKYGIAISNSGYSGPDHQITGTYVEAIGGYAGYFYQTTELSFGFGTVFYSHPSDDGSVHPNEAVLIGEANNVTGWIVGTCNANSQYMVNFTGTTRSVSLYVKGTVKYGGTTLVHTPGATFDSTTPFLHRIWTGQNGPDTGRLLLDESGNVKVDTMLPFEKANVADYAYVSDAGVMDLRQNISDYLLVQGTGRTIKSVLMGARGRSQLLILQAANALTIENNTDIATGTGANLALPANGKAMLKFSNKIEVVSVYTGKEAVAPSYSASAAGMGASATASSSASGTPATNANDGILAYNPLPFWQSSGQTPQWLEINHHRLVRCESATVVSLQDTFNNPVLPDLGTQGSTFVIRDFRVQYYNGSAWVDLATVTNNTNVLRTVSFGQVMAQRFRVYITRGGTVDSFARLAQAYFSGPDVLAPLLLAPESSGNSRSLNGLDLDTSSVVDPSVNQLVRCNNKASAMDVTIDYTKAEVDVPFYVRKYDASSTGNITVKTTDPASSKIQSINGNFYDTFVISPTTLRTYCWVFNGVHFELISA